MKVSNIIFEDEKFDKFISYVETYLGYILSDEQTEYVYKTWMNTKKSAKQIAKDIDDAEYEQQRAQ